MQNTASQLARVELWAHTGGWARKRRLPPELWYTVAPFRVLQLSPLRVPETLPRQCHMELGLVPTPSPSTPGKKLIAFYFISGPYAASIPIRGITNYSLSPQNIQGGSFLSPCQHISFNCLRSHVRLRSLSSKIISFLCSLMTGPLVKPASLPASLPKI